MKTVENTKEKGCVYFFRHIGLSPVKIGYSSSASPLNRFDSFKTYAPYGSEILGFIQTDEAQKIEQELHSKFSAFRLKGEWFEINVKQVDEIISFYQNIEDVKEKNDFQLAYADYVMKKYQPIKDEIIYSNYKERAKYEFFDFIKKNKEKVNKKQLSKMFNVSRPTIYNWLKDV